jgi:chromosome segregation protein
LSEADKALKQAEAELATAREGACAKAWSAATKDRESVVERIVERLRCEPRRAGAGRVHRWKLPRSTGRHRLERLVHERETMGAVNLRAEEEASEPSSSHRHDSRARRPCRRHPAAPGHQSLNRGPGASSSPSSR